MAFDPTSESLADFYFRADRLANAIEVLQESGDADPLMESGTLAVVKSKASIIDEIFKACGGKVPTSGDMLKMLSDRFVETAQSPDADSDAKTAYAIAVQQLVASLGARESDQASKIWSTPSDPNRSAFGSPPKLSETSPVRPLSAHINATPVRPGDSGVPNTDMENQRLREKVAELELELLGRDVRSEASPSEAGGPSEAASTTDALLKTLVQSQNAQTEAITKALTSGLGGRSTLTGIAAKVEWRDLTDEQSEAKDVREFYEHFEDNCQLANDCRGMSFREMLVALRPRCKGARLKTFQIIYKREWKAGVVQSDPEAVYNMIKKKHLMFAETVAEKEIRIHAEWTALRKGKLTGQQFEPLFESAITDLESVGLGKSVRELYLQYMQKINSELQLAVRTDRRIWPGETIIREPETWEEAHKVVLEFEQRKHLTKVAAQSVLATRDGTPSGGKSSEGDANKKLQKTLDDNKKQLEALKQQIAVLNGKASANGNRKGGGGSGGSGQTSKVCFNMRDHGS